MQHPDEGTIHAWLDGALTAEEAAGVESHAAQCDECSAAIAEARGLIAASSRILLALDDVPGGVIPVAARKPRAWYVRNEFRAAAAVLLVASASLVLARGGQDASPRGDEAVSAIADIGASTVAPETRTMEAAPAPSTEAPAAAPFSASVSASVQAAPLARDRKAAMKDEADLSGKGVTGHSAAGVESTSTRRIRSVQLQLESVVVTGVVTANASVIAAPLKIVRADTAQRVRTIVYEVSKGVEVTLTETEPMDFSQKSLLRSRVAGAGVNTPSAPLAPPAAATVPPVAGSAQSVMSAAQINSISWTDAVTGRNYILTGALPREQLEALKTRITEQRR